MFKWKKVGAVFCPNGEFPWMKSHASNPTPVPLPNGNFRVFFSSRDAQNRSHICWVDLDGSNFTMVAICDRPVVYPGSLGHFDDSGAAMGCIVQLPQKQYLYYLGWNLKVTVPWLNSIGLAVADPGETNFQKFSVAPIMDRSREDPFSLSYPFVIFEKGLFRMWYGSNLSWGKRQSQMNHVIKYAESQDGIVWTRSNQICIDLNQTEYAISRPCVMEFMGRYFMWYSYRGEGNDEAYRIGLAESDNGLEWKRIDEHVAIDVSESGWDSQMLCYAYVIEHQSQLVMFYNGNEFGKTGFGIAINEITI